MKRSTMSASQAQREKVREESWCRVCLGSNVDPAHAISRAQGGCDDPECVLPLCRKHHDEYDHARTLDVLPYATRAEQAHAVAHVGIAAAYRRLTNSRGVL